MSRFLSAAAVFLAGFTAALWLFFPYQILIGSIIDKTEKNMRIDIDYRTCTSGIMSTEYTDVTLNGREIGDVSISHSPLKLFTGRIGVTVRGIYSTEAVLSRTSAVFEMETTGKALDFVKEPVFLEGNVQINGVINQISGTSEITALFDRMVMKSPIGEMRFENVAADVAAENGRIKVKSLKSEDRNELNLSGILILKSRPSDSYADLKGSIRFLGKKKNLTLRGSADNLHPLLD